MGKILSLIASVLVVLVTIYAFAKKPPVVLGPDGFPVNRKIGDTFVKNGVIYVFTSDGWIVKQSSGGSGTGAGRYAFVFFPLERNGLIDGEIRKIGGKNYRWTCRTTGGQTLCGWTSI